MVSSWEDALDNDPRMVVNAKNVYEVMLDFEALEFGNQIKITVNLDIKG